MKKATSVKEEVVGREIIDNIVHYKLKHLKKSKPIYEFGDFGPIFEFELMQTQKDNGEWSNYFL